ncbi:MAG: 3'-5' exoribonuclease [Bacteroidales bacterium]|nr:3'-5' exoribonuclease [Bacteroidales bacterium]MBP8678589.1 3'-5' exoribonuclease [Bacteroidales bacterium]
MGQQVTKKQSTSPQVWHQIELMIEGLPLVAHNKGFDENCLKACFQMYQLDYPYYEFHCTLQRAKKQIKGLPDYKLSTVSAYCDFSLGNHHHALADAEACARIAIQVFVTN